MDSYAPLVDTLTALLGSDLNAVVLFGSQARGDGHEDSDHDILVVANRLPPSPIERQRLLRSSLRPISDRLPGSWFAFLPRTPAEVASNLSPLLIDVCADGRCLVGADYFERLRAKALAAVDQAGLRRTRVAGALMWVFPAPRLTDWRLDWDGFHDRI